MPEQLSLGFDQPTVFSRESFIVSAANAEALGAVDSWPQWPRRTLALVGPAGSGKSHLASLWARDTEAVEIVDLGPPVESLEGRPVLLEEADRPGRDELLFHLINMAGRPGGGLLLTARTAPAEWPVSLPDLRSRLNALTVAPLGELDDTVLRGVLEKLFRERSIRPPEDLLDYLVLRIERSAAHAKAVVAQLDAVASAEHRAVSRVLAGRVLDLTPELDFRGPEDERLQ